MAKQITTQLEDREAIPRSAKKESSNSKNGKEIVGDNMFVNGIEVKMTYLVEKFNTFHIVIFQLITLVSLLLRCLVFFKNVCSADDTTDQEKLSTLPRKTYGLFSGAKNNIIC